MSDRLEVYRKVIRYLAPYKKEFVFALICMVLFGASDGVVPFLVKYVLDGVFSQRKEELLYLLPVVLICFAIFRALVDFGQQFLMAKVGHNIVRDIRSEINRHLLKLSPDYFVSHSSANLISRITSDVILVRTLLTESVAAILRDLIRIIALVSAAIYLDPLLAMIAVLALPIGVIPVYKFGRRVRKFSRQGQQAIGSLSAMMQEAIIGNRVVKIFGRENYEIERFDAENERLNTTFVRSERVRALTGPVNEILATLAVSGVMLYGGLSVISGVRSQGDFIAFILAVFLLYDPFKKLSRVNNVVQQGLAGAERVFEVLSAMPGVADPESPIALTSSNRIEFKGVSFTYRGSDIPALYDINLTVEEGQKVALVGFSGAGKSTMMDLLARFIDPTEGTVKIGEVDISRVRLAELRARLAMVGQHTFLFNDTVFNNILYGNPNATAEQVYQAARAAYAFDFISQLPNGFDSMIGESGLSLSGGERQRIAIARALLKDAPILILDEATASLDTRAEREVQSALETLTRGRTSLIIAHRLSTVRRVDVIMVLKDGRIVEKGGHDELLALGAEYAKLYDLQFEDKDDGSDVDEALIN
ncbi:MAG: ATP-binding cassette domain-containing protein [Deltaproteobacteria bacterium]|nr:ATP-binding cassette domain-containing protein [Deltaproteobacteria bacterium]